ncbi:MAG TPA: AAC(3) family N-acetyltransferase [Bacillota bacterium]|nr:AAC(3) family N-acetyltransferase [Bacillota bacterium]
MSEHQTVINTPEVRTRQTLARDLIELGLRPGFTVIVHSSLSSLGWVSGGPVAVIQALMDVVTPEGTIVMPAHSGDYSDPQFWANPPVPPEWRPVIMATMPAFEPQITPTRGIGKIPETFRSFPGVIRSSHPAVSFTAWGNNAVYITSNHSLDNSLSELSPLARIYDLDGYVLLLGAGYGSNTSFHLAEYRAPGYKNVKAGAPILENGVRVWKEYLDIEFDVDPFPAIGLDFEKENPVSRGKVGSAETRLFKQRKAVDFATQWLERNRKVTT